MDWVDGCLLSVAPQFPDYGATHTTSDSVRHANQRFTDTVTVGLGVAFQSKELSAMSGSGSKSQLLSLISECATEAAVGKELCWDHFVSHSMFRAWMAKYSGGDAVVTARLTQLELENVRLRRALGRAKGDLQRSRTANATSTGHA